MDLVTKMSLTGQTAKSTNNHVMEKIKEMVHQESKEMMMWVINMKLIIKDCQSLLILQSTR